MLLWGKDPLLLPDFSSGRAIRVAGASLHGRAYGCLSQPPACLMLWSSSDHAGRRAMRACASCKPGAKLVGININRMTVLSLASAPLSERPPASWSPRSTFAQYDMGHAGPQGMARHPRRPGQLHGGIVAVSLSDPRVHGAGFVDSAYKDAIAFIILLIISFARRRACSPEEDGLTD